MIPAFPLNPVQGEGSVPDGSGYAVVLSDDSLRPPKALSARNQSSWGEPTGQPRFSHNSWASLPTVSWSGSRAVRLARDPTVFRVSFPCLDMNRRSSLSVRYLDGYPCPPAAHL